MCVATTPVFGIVIVFMVDGIAVVIMVVWVSGLSVIVVVSMVDGLSVIVFRMGGWHP